MRFGLFFFGSHEKPADLGESPYSLFLDAARFADRNSLAFVSMPERHFARFGGLFPNPALTGAAVAATTSRVQIRAGSVLSPLHDSVRLVEDWSVVDVMSGGRVALAFDTGWNADHFVLAPNAYASRRALMHRQIDEIRTLWQTRSVRRGNGAGEQVDIGVYPVPVTTELPVWMTVTGDPQAFGEAGRMGVNVLTDTAERDLRELGDHVDRYRRARAAAGFDPHGVVTVTQYTYVSDEPADLDAATADLAGHLGGAAGVEPPGRPRPAARRLAARDSSHRASTATSIHSAYRCDATGNHLVGSVAACARRVRQLERAGVDEVACVVDFVAEPDLLRRGLPGLAALRRTCADPGQAEAARMALDRFMGWG